MTVVVTGRETADVYDLPIFSVVVLPMPQLFFLHSLEQCQTLNFGVEGLVFSAFLKACCCHHRKLAAGALTLLHLDRSTHVNTFWF